MLTGVSGKGFVYQAGGIYDLPPGEAEGYIRWKRAELVEEPKQRKVVVQKVRKTSKRPIYKK